MAHRNLKLQERYKNVGKKGISKKSKPLTFDQFLYIIDEFEDRGDWRMVLLCHFLFRCIRINDCLVTIQKKDIYAKAGRIRDKIEYTESKTSKLRVIPVAGERFLKALRLYYSEIKSYKDTDKLFYSIKTKEVLSHRSVRYLFSEFKDKRGIEQCSPHSFRKAGARWMFENGVRIEMIQNVLNHHHPSVTERYINIVPNDIIESMECLAI